MSQTAAIGSSSVNAWHWAPLRARLHEQVCEPIDGASLAVFRLLFGVLMAASTVRFMAFGWIDEFYVRPAFYFTWEMFPWVTPLPAAGLHALFVGLVLLAVMTACGLFYRAAALLFFLGFTYIELIDKTTYLNHYYLATLLSGLLVVLPASQVWSIDSWRAEVGGHAWRNATVPAWTINLLRFQVGIVYVFAGLAKINSDWLLDAEPLRIWLAARSDVPLLGPFLAEAWVAYAFSWGGALYDLTIAFFLLWRPSRVAAYVTVVVFHVLTWVLFPIGIFPWMMIIATSIFFPPDWPRRFFRRATRVSPRTSMSAPAVVVPRWQAILIGVYVSIQLVLPLRAYWPDQDPDWSYDGFNFAWRVMVAEKAGHTELRAVDDDTGRQFEVRLRDYITDRQEKMMAQDPFMIRDLARHIARTLSEAGASHIRVYADSYAALNGGPVQRLIDPTVDLVGDQVEDWIVPRASRATSFPREARTSSRNQFANRRRALPRTPD